MKKTIFLFLFLAMATPLTAQYCPVDGNSISVFHWKASKGTVARYTAGVLDTCDAKGIIIFLGCDSLTVYAIESGWEDDARGGSYARLVRAGYDGTLSTSLIYDGDLLEPHLETDSLRTKQRELVLGKIWQLSSQKKIPASLQPVKYRKYKNSGNVKVSIPDQNKKLSWQLVAQSSMCWCIYHWDVNLE